MDGEVWHLVEARRDDGAPTIFRIRELEPRPELSRIFVVEMPYPITEMSRLPDATGYRRLAQFEEQWVAPACVATGYTQVGLKIEEGSFFSSGFAPIGGRTSFSMNSALRLVSSWTCLVSPKAFMHGDRP